MRKGSYNNNKITIIEADEGKYLVPKDLPEGTDLSAMGKPTKIILDNSGKIPEFTEKYL